VAQDSRAIITSLLQGLQRSDPRLYDILRLFFGDLYGAIDVLIPETIDAKLAEIITAAPKTHAVDTFTNSVQPRSVRFNWTNSDPNVREYELRKGTVWETATFQLRTASTQVDINPLPTGVHHFLLKTINADGVYAEETSGTDVTIDPIGTIIVTTTVIDNNVLLSWTTPTSPFTIDHYIVKKALDPGPPIEFAQISGTFLSSFETVSGSYIYSVTPVDVFGNVGPESQVTAEVSQPPDFSLQAEFLSTFTGTKNNCVLQSTGRLLANVDTTETWTTHFTARGWNTIADQVAAGYNMYALPALTTGYYEEVIDYGAIFSNVIVNLNWSFNPIIGTVSIQSVISASDDDITYTATSAGPTQFYASLRYVKVRINFTGVDDKSLVEFFNFKILLDVKREMDSGQVNAISTDAGGTVVLFNKPFKDVDSVTVTTQETTVAIAVADFVDIPNPTQFKVLVFDSAFARISKLVYWKARGVV